MANPNNITFFDEESNPQDEVIPTIQKVIQDALNGFASELRVCVPAKVLGYDYQSQSVDVQPYFQRVYNTGKTVDMPPIYKVPVVFPRGGSAFISVPINAGDTVLLVFSDRSLEGWLSSGAVAPPPDTKMHHISDAFAIPGGYPFSNPAPVSNPTDLILHNGSVEMRVKANGHFQIISGINTASSQELVQVLNDMLQAILDARTPTANGPQPLVNPKWPEIQAKLKTFLEGG